MLLNIRPLLYLFAGARGVQQGRVDEDDQARHAVDAGVRGILLALINI